MTDFGYPFMFGVYGKKPTRESVALLRKTGACGVLLLGRNIETAEQTRALTEEFVQRVGRPLLFSVDHEGGWVLRFKSGVTAFPGNAALGRSGDPKLAYAVGAAMGAELFDLGIHINLAPVLDVVDGYNPGIGIRSFGPDPRTAGLLGAAMVSGLQDNGVCACAKHFPGKGAAQVDAHVELPRIVMPRSQFERVHLAPFAQAIEAGVDCVMTSHVRFPKLDRVPATFSRKITEGLLRRRLGFSGAVISDDLCMGAVARERPIQLAAVSALEAGHDILLIAHDRETQREAAELLERQVQDGAIAASRIEESCGRIRRLFARSSRRPAPPDRRAARALSTKIAASAVEVFQQGRTTLPFEPDGRPPLVLLPDFSEVADKFTFEGGPAGPEAEVKRVLALWGEALLRRTPIESKDMGGLKDMLKDPRRILFFCFEAKRFPGQKAVLDLLKKAAPERTVAALIRGPWDREFLSPAMTGVDSGSYRSDSLRAVLKVVLGLWLLALGLFQTPALWAVSTADIRHEFISATDLSLKQEMLKTLSNTAPASAEDIHALYDLFARFAMPEVREAAMKSLHLLKPGNPTLGEAILPYFQEKDPEALIFAVNGALAVRDERALPLLRKLAKKKFPAKGVSDLALMTERNQWWAQYEALSALAQWQGKEAMPLLRQKAGQAPAVARLMASYAWKETLPEIISWSRSSSPGNKELEKNALAAPVEPARLRETYDEMLKLVRDGSAEKELRHQLAIKTGQCSSPAELEGFLKEIDAPADKDLALLLTTAVFASRSPLGQGLLKRYVRENPDPAARSGALAQLKDLLTERYYRSVLDWVVKNDSDAANREEARRQLEEPKKP